MKSMQHKIEEDVIHWHTLNLSDVYSRIRTTEDGLTSSEARERLQSVGRNTLPHKKPPTLLEICLRQFKSPLIYILLLAGGISVAVGHADDAVFILLVLLMNAAIGAYQEMKAERSSQALQKLLHIRASVQRDNDVQEVDAEVLVPGDIVWLESGNRVPADLRLISAHGLEVDESLLTGESIPVTKDPAWIGKPTAALGDRLNMAFAGAIVTRGRAKGVVVQTGVHTVVGALAVDVQSTFGGRPPLLDRMEEFSRAVAIAVLISASLVGLFGVLLRGFGWIDMFMFSVVLAVSAIPEGLPVALTVALSVATTRMSKRGVIVRRLAAVEGLGSCTMIASDKTGTLTCNELTVRNVYLPDGTEVSITGTGYSPEGTVQGANGERLSLIPKPLTDLAYVAALCNEADLHKRDSDWVWHGDPTDVALLSFGHKAQVIREQALERYPLVHQIPFEPELRYAATFHTGEGGGLICVKGAPEKVLGMCSVTAAQREQFLAHAEHMATRGLRVLALARGITTADNIMSVDEPQNLDFLGFVGMTDPLRPGVVEAIQDCRKAGITVCMITGDHPVTALTIAQELGMATTADQVITGNQLAQLSREELVEAMQHVRVFARTSPRQKQDLVEVAREIGHYVAVTGDGVNDAPALRQANIGVAMGKAGTDVAREAAELVIADDNFATIVAGVEEGRIAYDNVRKVVFLLVSCGAAEVLMLGLAIATGYPDTNAGALVLPLLPVQILWLNLVTNGIQDIAIAFEPADGDVLARPPRPASQKVFDAVMIQRTLVSALVMAVVSFSAFVYMVEEGGWSHEEARNALLLLMVLFQNIHIGNCRSETRSVFVMNPLKSKALLIGTLSALAVHLLAMHIPFTQKMLNIAPVSLNTMLAMFALALTIVVANELQKLWMRTKRAALAR